MEEVPASKWFCPRAPNKPRFLGSHCRISPRFSSMAIHIWLGIWKNIIKLLPMGLMFAPGLMVLCLGTKVFIHGGFPTCSSIMLSNLGGPHPTRKNVGIYNHPICNYMQLCVVCNYFCNYLPTSPKFWSICDHTMIMQLLSSSSSYVNAPEIIFIHE
jgi:hypothetical protein